MTRTEAILHPVRARILAILHGGPSVPARIAERMPDVPLGSLYRHLNLLVEARMIEVTDEEKRRGPNARVYSVARASDIFEREDLAALDPEKFVRILSLLTAMIEEEGARFAGSPEFSTEPGSFGAIVKPISLTEAERVEIRGQIRALFAKADRDPPEGARPWLVGHFAIPQREPDA